MELFEQFFAENCLAMVWLILQQNYLFDIFSQIQMITFSAKYFHNWLYRRSSLWFQLLEFISGSGSTFNSDSDLRFQFDQFENRLKWDVYFSPCGLDITASFIQCAAKSAKS